MQVQKTARLTRIGRHAIGSGFPADHDEVNLLLRRRSIPLFPERNAQALIAGALLKFGPGGRWPLRSGELSSLQSALGPDSRGPLARLRRTRLPNCSGWQIILTPKTAPRFASVLCPAPLPRPLPVRRSGAASF